MGTEREKNLLYLRGRSSPDYGIAMEQIDYLGKKIVRWKRGTSTFLAWPEGGARLLNWNLAYGDGHIRDVIHWPDLGSLENIASVRGGNPILFPFCGRCFDRGEKFRWRWPADTVRPMPMHGFARDGEFETTSLTSSGFSARLKPREQDLEAYPFRYEFTVAYRFEELALYVELSLKNLDTKPIPWSAGHHFYFTLPWIEGTGRDDYRIEIPAREAFRHAPDGTLSPVPDFPSADSFGNSDLRDRIHTRLSSDEVRFFEKNGNGEVTLTVGPAGKVSDGTSIVVWTEKDSSPFYCVEPWMGPPNSPEHRIGLHWVEPGKQDTFLAEIRLK